MMISTSLKRERMVLESRTEVKVRDQLKQGTSEVVKILSSNSQSCSWCRSINISVVQSKETMKNIKVLDKADTATSVAQARTSHKTTMATVVSSVMIAQESWWVSQTKWVLDVDKLKVEINFWGKTHTVRWETLFVDLSTEMIRAEAGSNKYQLIILTQSSRRTWAVQARCISSTIQTTSSIKLPRAHIETESVIILKPLQSVTKAQTKTW